MNGSNFMHGWARLVESVATIALILTALVLMLGIVKPVDALKRVGAILGIVVMLMLIPGVIVSTWSGMSLWQQLGLAAIALGIWLRRRPRRQTNNKSRE